MITDDRPTDTVAHARDVVGRRLLDAACRENLGNARTLGLPARRLGFDRVEVTDTVTAAPSAVLATLGINCPRVGIELDDAAENLAIAYGRWDDVAAGWRTRATERGATDAYAVVSGDTADDQVIAFERLATEGHNLHPCGRTRLGWSPADVLAYDQEAAPFELGFVALRREAHVGDDVGAVLAANYPQVPAAPPGFVVQPVHPWQRSGVLRTRYASLYADDVLRDLPGAITAAPTSAIRTVLLEPGRTGPRHYLKVSLDIQITSTRRSISIASTRNGPRITELLAELTADDSRVLLMPELAGAAMSTGRDVAAIVRGGLTGRIGDDEVAVPAAALPAISPVTGRTVIAELVDRFGAARGVRFPALPFLSEYAQLLLSPVLRLLDAGVGYEAHLQNCIPVFRDGVPVRIALRDFAGMRLHRPVLERFGELWPGSVIATDDLDVVRAKAGYTALQAHLGEVIARLYDSHRLPEPEAWARVRRIIDGLYADHGWRAGDRAFLIAPTMPHKALVRMRLHDRGDMYVAATNPLHNGV